VHWSQQQYLVQNSIRPTLSDYGAVLSHYLHRRQCYQTVQLTLCNTGCFLRPRLRTTVAGNDRTASSSRHCSKWGRMALLSNRTSQAMVPVAHWNCETQMQQHTRRNHFHLVVSQREYIHRYLAVVPNMCRENLLQPACFIEQLYTVYVSK